MRLKAAKTGVEKVFVLGGASFPNPLHIGPSCPKLIFPKFVRSGSSLPSILHLGPGLGNGLANLHNARRGSTPVVNIVGDHATYHKECYGNLGVAGHALDTRSEDGGFQVNLQ